MSQQVLLCEVILTYISQGPDHSEAVELLREVLRSVLTVSGLRPSCEGLSCLWCVITSAQNVCRNGESHTSFWYQATDIASAAPNMRHSNLSELKSKPWAHCLRGEIPKALAVLDDWLQACPSSKEHDGAQVAILVNDCRLSLEDILDGVLSASAS